MFDGLVPQLLANFLTSSLAAKDPTELAFALLPEALLAYCGGMNHTKVPFSVLVV